MDGRVCENRRAPWSASELLLLMMGMGLYLGWRTIDISPTLFPAAGEAVSQALTRSSYAGTVLTVAALAAAVLNAKFRRALSCSRAAIAVAAVGPAVASILIYSCGWLLPDPWIPGVVLGRTLYFTSALLFAMWGGLLCTVGWKNVLACVSGAYLVAFCVCLVSAGLDAPGVFAFRSACPLLSGAAMLAIRHDRASREGAPSDEAAPDPSARRLPMRVFVGIAIFGAVFAIANTLSETKTTVSTELFTLFAGTAASLVILAAAAATRRRSGNFSLLFRLLTPLVMVCLILTLLLEEGSQHYEAFAIGFSWVFFRIFAWTMWAYVGSRSEHSGIAAFAAGQLCLTLSATAAELFCSLVDLSSLPLAAAVSAIILVTVLTSALVMNEGSVAHVLPAEKDRGEEGPAEAREAAEAWRDATADDLSRAMAPCGLSERECQIALLVMRGGGNAAVCDEACITESTLRTHLRNIYGKTSTHSRGELVELLKQRLNSSYCNIE